MSQSLNSQVSQSPEDVSKETERILAEYERLFKEWTNVQQSLQAVYSDLGVTQERVLKFVEDGNLGTENQQQFDEMMAELEAADAASAAGAKSAPVPKRPRMMI
ncbi:MAG: hypothetical protein KDA80_04955 [Planctomycetaceae bacterium]|nr:hypothetical protein [Planctomycetaceae bacterium]